VFDAYNNEMVRWCRKAADQGLPEAQFNLGNTLHRRGKGIAGDYKNEVHWYRSAADRSLVKAELNLGCMYSDQKQVTQKP